MVRFADRLLKRAFRYCSIFIVSDFALIWCSPLTDCLDISLNPSGCTLNAGRYEIEDMPIILDSHNSFTITSAGDGEVVIDGTKELALTWKECLSADHADCSAGVYVADLNGLTPFQLFMGGDDIHTRDLILPARWPNVPAKPDHFPADAPSWAHAFDSRRAWSIVKTDNDDCAGPEPEASCESRRTDGLGGGMDTGKIVDDGDSSRTVHIETEDGDAFDLTIQGQGALHHETFSAAGATLLISFGKRMVEVGQVMTHAAGSDEFTYRMPACSTELYCSCGKKAKFMDIKYYFENAVALIDQHYEYAVHGGKLYMKLDPATDLNSAGGGQFTLKPAKKVWARLETSVAAKSGGASDDEAFVAGAAFDVKSHTVEVSGITFFATSLVASVSKKNTKILGNTFLYPFASRRVAGVFEYPTMPHLDIHGTGSQVKNNIIKYSEGMAVEAGGNNFVLENNLFAWNGFLSPDGPQTVLFSSGTVTRNELYWNGQVSGFKLTGELVPYRYNDIIYQGYGQLLHDGAGFHVQTAAQDGTFEYNWVSECHQSLGIRFDTASTTTMDQIGRHGRLNYNILYKAPMVLKGDEHRIHRNTIIDSKMQLVRAFGEQQGMNDLTEATENLLTSAPVPRGSQWSGAGNTPSSYDKVVSNPSESGTALNWMSLSQKWGWEAKSDFTSDSTLAFDGEVDKDAILREVKNSGGVVVADWDDLILLTEKTGTGSLFQTAAQTGYVWRWRTERRPQGPDWTLGGTISGNDIGGAANKVRNFEQRDFRPIDTVTAGAYTAQTNAADEAYWIPGFQDVKARKASPTPGSTSVPTSSSLMFLQARGCTEHTIELSKNGGPAQSHLLTGGKNVWNFPGLEQSTSYTWRVVCGAETSEWWAFSTAADGGTGSTSGGSIDTSGVAATSTTGSAATSGNTATSGGGGITSGGNAGSGNIESTTGSGSTGSGGGGSMAEEQGTSGSSNLGTSDDTDSQNGSEADGLGEFDEASSSNGSDNLALFVIILACSVAGVSLVAGGLTVRYKIHQRRANATKLEPDNSLAMFQSEETFGLRDSAQATGHTNGVANDMICVANISENVKLDIDKSAGVISFHSSVEKDSLHRSNSSHDEVQKTCTSSRSLRRHRNDQEKKLRSPRRQRTDQETQRKHSVHSSHSADGGTLNPKSPIDSRRLKSPTSSRRLKSPRSDRAMTTEVSSSSRRLKSPGPDRPDRAITTEVSISAKNKTEVHKVKSTGALERRDRGEKRSRSPERSRTKGPEFRNMI